MENFYFNGLVVILIPPVKCWILMSWWLLLYICQELNCAPPRLSRHGDIHELVSSFVNQFILLSSFLCKVDLKTLGSSISAGIHAEPALGMNSFSYSYTQSSMPCFSPMCTHMCIRHTRVTWSVLIFWCVHCWASLKNSISVAPQLAMVKLSGSQNKTKKVQMWKRYLQRGKVLTEVEETELGVISKLNTSMRLPKNKFN